MAMTRANCVAKAPELSIIVVSYNTRQMTLDCLTSVVEQTQCVSYELIVVDNASSDGSAEALGRHPGVSRLIALDENIGFARANNLAVAEARGAFVLLLNPDTIVLDRAIDRLMSFAEKTPSAMIWGGRTLFRDGRLNPTSAYGRMTPWRLLCRATGLAAVLPKVPLFNGEAIAGWDRDSEREVDIVTGCLLLTTRELWQRLGGFDPVFFMYGEETDLCLRARKLGARPRIAPEVTIVHFGGASEATREGKLVKLLAAKATLIERHFTAPMKVPGLFLNAMWPLTRWFALSVWGRLTGRDTDLEKANVWRSIWQRREEWIGGYARPPKEARRVIGSPARAVQ